MSSNQQEPLQSILEDMLNLAKKIWEKIYSHPMYKPASKLAGLATVCVGVVLYNRALIIENRKQIEDLRQEVKNVRIEGKMERKAIEADIRNVQNEVRNVQHEARNERANLNLQIQRFQHETEKRLERIQSYFENK